MLEICLEILLALVYEWQLEQLSLAWAHQSLVEPDTAILRWETTKEHQYCYDKKVNGQPPLLVSHLEHPVDGLAMN